jgi:hypothetical protein
LWRLIEMKKWKKKNWSNANMFNDRIQKNINWMCLCNSRFFTFFFKDLWRLIEMKKWKKYWNNASMFDDRTRKSVE